MSPDEQRVAIGQACGAMLCKCRDGTERWSMSEDTLVPMPDYPNDLNAMHDAEKVLTNDQYITYEENLLALCDPEKKSDGTFHATGWIRWASATAAQRAEAFLRVIKEAAMTPEEHLSASINSNPAVSVNPEVLKYDRYAASLYTDLRWMAQSKGYSLSLQGTIGTYLDILAVPWIEEAVSADVIEKAILDISNGCYVQSNNGNEIDMAAHGRRTCRIQLRSAPMPMFIDLSITPRRPA